MKVRLEEDYPEYDNGPRGGDILEVISQDDGEGVFYCKFGDDEHFAIYEYEVEEIIEDD